MNLWGKNNEKKWGKTKVKGICEKREKDGFVVNK